MSLFSIHTTCIRHSYEPCRIQIGCTETAIGGGQNVNSLASFNRIVSSLPLVSLHHRHGADTGGRLFVSVKNRKRFTTAQIIKLEKVKNKKIKN